MHRSLILPILLRHTAAVLALIAGLAVLEVLSAQTTDPVKGAVERVPVHGQSLENNLSGDSPDRRVSIYLPPSYEADEDRRYPVLYMLHGFTDSDEKWMGLRDHWINLPQILNDAIAADRAKEMIVVMPNAYTRFAGSMYSSSVTVGDWETYIADELVAYIDANYRTLPNRQSRGLAGHSMGGYGAMRIGMKNSDVFGAVYLLSPCCLAPRIRSDRWEEPSPAESIQTDEAFAEASFGTKATIATSAAWAPNPGKPPFYLDLPFENGELRPEIVAKFTANAPLAAIDQHIFSIRRFEAIGIDAGDQDRGIAAAVRALNQVLEDYDVPHEFEIYEGDHTNRVAERIADKVLPFFSENLTF